MGYPNYPNNRMIVEGIDLTETFGMILADGYTLNPPTPKIYTIDIPGGNGKIDLTNALSGDVPYDNRTQTFTFYVVGFENFESVKTNITNFLHGRNYSYRLSMDPNYTYKGRFSVMSYEHNRYSVGNVGSISISIEAEPYKYLDNRVYSINASGGTLFSFPSGRLRVKPKFTIKNTCELIFGDATVNLSAGTYTINDLIFVSGYNDVFMSTREVKFVTYSNFENNNLTWGAISNKRIYEWYRSPIGTYYEPIVKTDNDIVTVEYSWGDL